MLVGGCRLVEETASIFDSVRTRLPGVGKLVQGGIRDLGEAEHRFSEDSGGRIVTHYDARTRARMVEGETWGALCREIVSALPLKVYVSFDIDGLDPTLCPHTGTPVPGGLSFSEATALVAEVIRSGRTIIGLDLNEVAPGPDSEWDGNVGARLLYKMIGWMQSR